MLKQLKWGLTLPESCKPFRHVNVLMYMGRPIAIGHSTAIFRVWGTGPNGNVKKIVYEIGYKD